MQEWLLLLLHVERIGRLLLHVARLGRLLLYVARVVAFAAERGKDR